MKSRTVVVTSESLAQQYALSDRNTPFVSKERDTKEQR